MSKIKNKDEFKERDEIDAYFGEIKNKSFPTGIIFIFLFLIIIGGLLFYYFIIDSPKNIFLTIVNNKLKTNNVSHEKINYQFNLDTDINSTNKQYIDNINIINNIAIKGMGGIDLKSNKSYSKIDTFYKGEELLTLTTYSEFDKNIYFKSEDLFDKPIKVTIENTTTKNNNNSHMDTNNMKELYNLLIDVLTPLLNDAKYNKTYTNLNNILVKKITLYIDATFKKNFYNSLLENDELLEKISKLQGLSKKEVENQINEQIHNIDESDIEEISLYLSILYNQFISLEIVSEENKLTINKDSNKYTYKLYDDEIIEYLGYITVNKTNNDYEMLLSYEDVKNDLNIKLNLELFLDYNKNVETMDTTKAIDYQKLTENDINKIITNLGENNNLINLIMDIQAISETNKTTA